MTHYSSSSILVSFACPTFFYFVLLFLSISIGMLSLSFFPCDHLLLVCLLSHPLSLPSPSICLSDPSSDPSSFCLCSTRMSYSRVINVDLEAPAPQIQAVAGGWPVTSSPSIMVKESWLEKKMPSTDFSLNKLSCFETPASPSSAGCGGRLHYYCSPTRLFPLSFFFVGTRFLCVLL
jgi:hypothetical protein